MAIPEKPHKAWIDCYCPDEGHHERPPAELVLTDIYRAKAFAMLPRVLQDRIYGLMRKK